MRALAADSLARRLGIEQPVSGARRDSFPSVLRITHSSGRPRDPRTDSDYTEADCGFLRSGAAALNSAGSSSVGRNGRSLRGARRNSLEGIATLGKLDQEFLRVEIEPVARFAERRAFMRADVFAAREQNPRFFRVRQIRLQLLRHDLGAQSRILQAEHHLDALVNVALHPVRAAQINLRSCRRCQTRKCGCAPESGRSRCARGSGC